MDTALREVLAREQAKEEAATKAAGVSEGDDGMEVAKGSRTSRGSNREAL